MRPSKDHPTPTRHHSVVEVIPNSTLQLRRTLAEHTRQIFQIIASGNAELAHEVLCRSLQIAVVLDATRALLVFGAAEVSVRGDGLCALEALQTCLGLGLCGWVEGAFAEELVGGDTLLNTELLAGVALGVVWGVIVSDLSPGTTIPIVLSLPSTGALVVEPKPIVLALGAAAFAAPPPICPNPSLRVLVFKRSISSSRALCEPLP
jgi:hypothetical protein